MLVLSGQTNENYFMLNLPISEVFYTRFKGLGEIEYKKAVFSYTSIPSEPQIGINRLKLPCFWCLYREFLCLEITKPAFQDNPDLKIQTFLYCDFYEI